MSELKQLKDLKLSALVFPCEDGTELALASEKYVAEKITQAIVYRGGADVLSCDEEHANCIQLSQNGQILADFQCGYYYMFNNDISISGVSYKRGDHLIFNQNTAEYSNPYVNLSSVDLYNNSVNTNIMFTDVDQNISSVKTFLKVPQITATQEEISCNSKNIVNVEYVGSGSAALMDAIGQTVISADMSEQAIISTLSSAASPFFWLQDENGNKILSARTANKINPNGVLIRFNPALPIPEEGAVGDVGFRNDGTLVVALAANNITADTTGFGSPRCGVMRVPPKTANCGILLDQGGFLRLDQDYIQSTIEENQHCYIESDENGKAYKRSIPKLLDYSSVNMRSIVAVSSDGMAAIATNWSDGGLYSTEDGRAWEKITLSATNFEEDFSSNKFPWIMYDDNRMLLVTDNGVMFTSQEIDSIRQISEPIEWTKTQLYSDDTNILSVEQNVSMRLDDIDEVKQYFIGGNNGSVRVSIDGEGAVQQTAYSELSGVCTTGICKMPSTSSSSLFVISKLNGISQSSSNGVPNGGTSWEKGRNFANTGVITWQWLNAFSDGKKYLICGDGGDNKNSDVNRKTDIYMFEDETWQRADVTDYPLDPTNDTKLEVYCFSAVVKNGTTIGYVAIGRQKNPNEGTTYRLFVSKDAIEWKQHGTFETSATNTVLNIANVRIDDEDMLLISTGEGVKCIRNIPNEMTYDEAYQELVTTSMTNEIYQNETQISSKTSIIRTVKNLAVKDQAELYGTLLPISSLTVKSGLPISNISVDYPRGSFEKPSYYRYCHLFKYTGTSQYPTYAELGNNCSHIMASDNSVEILSSNGNTGIFKNVYTFEFDHTAQENSFLSSDRVYVGFSDSQSDLSVSQMDTIRLGLLAADTSDGQYSYNLNGTWKNFTIGMIFEFYPYELVCKLDKNACIYEINDPAVPIRFDFSDVDSTKIIKFEVLIKNPNGRTVEFSIDGVTFVDIGGTFTVGTGNTLCEFRTFDGGQTILRRVEYTWN